MCALQFAAKLEQTKGVAEYEQTQSMEKLEALNIKLANYLETI
jgi:hypothetical protein